MPVQTPQWTEFLSCPICYNEFEASVRSPISLGCGHTVCKHCLSNLQRKQCPFDQTVIGTDLTALPENFALLQLVGGGNISSECGETVPVPSILPEEALQPYLVAKSCIEELALFLKPNGSVGCMLLVCSSASNLSRPMQRKLVTLVNCQLVEEEGRARAMRAARSLGERSVTELILQHQNSQQLSANLWAAVRARGCQFLGPAMQEEVLKLVLLALEDGSALSRKVLVMYVVQRLAPHFPQASKTSIGHVVQLLYRASCFKVSKREGDSSLMQLKEEFRTYDALRREHDAQIVQIATEAGLRIAPELWSSLLYGDTAHKSHMQSIIDKLQTPQSFAQSVQELVIALQRSGDPGNLSIMRPPLELLAGLDPSPDASPPTWEQLQTAMEATRTVVKGLVEFIQNFGSRKLHEEKPTLNVKYKTNMCRDLAQKGSCPRGPNCTFAHSQEEMDKYRTKTKRVLSRQGGLRNSSNLDAVLFSSPGGSPPENSYLPIDGTTSPNELNHAIPNHHFLLNGVNTTTIVVSQSSSSPLPSTTGSLTPEPSLNGLLNPGSPAFQPLSSTNLLNGSSVPVLCSSNEAYPGAGTPILGVIPAIAALPCGSRSFTKVALGSSLSCGLPENSKGLVKHLPLTRKYSQGQRRKQKSLAHESLPALQQRKQKLLAQLERLQQDYPIGSPSISMASSTCTSTYVTSNHSSSTYSTTSSASGRVSGTSLSKGNCQETGCAETKVTPSSSSCAPFSMASALYSPWMSGGCLFSNTASLDTACSVTLNASKITNSSSKAKPNPTMVASGGSIFYPSEIDEFIPFDPPLVSKYGPISRVSRSVFLRGHGAPIQVNTISQMGQLTSPTSVVCHPLPTASPAPSIFTGNPPQNFAFPVALISAMTEQYLSVGGAMVEPQSVVVPIAVPFNTSIKNHLSDYRPDIALEVEDLCKQMTPSQFQLEEELLAVEKTIQQKEFLLGYQQQEDLIGVASTKGCCVRPTPTSVGPWPQHQLEQQRTHILQTNRTSPSEQVELQQKWDIEGFGHVKEESYGFKEHATEAVEA